MNPAITMSGTVNGSSNKSYITRKLVTYISLGTATSLDVNGSNLEVPDGAKILSLKVCTLNGRILNVSIPNTTALVTNSGTTSAPFGGFTKSVAAPLSRFPTIKINIPDMLAAPIDGSGTAVLFSASTTGVTGLQLRVTFTAKYLA